MKKILVLLVGLSVGGMAFAAGEASSSVDASAPKMNSSSCHAKKSLNPTMMVGGWYPVFFNSYDQKQVDQIVKQIKEGRVASIKINYDQNAKLAKKIQAIIEKKTKFKTELTQTVNKDTELTQYNHTQVVLTVYQTKPAQANVESK